MSIQLEIAGTTTRKHEDLLDEVATWIKPNAGVAVIHLERAVSDDGQAMLFVGLHPCAEDLELMLDGTTLNVIAKTSTAGPGYHRHVCELLRRLGEEFALEWKREGASSSDFFFTQDSKALEVEFAEWLVEAATQILKGIEAGADQIALSMSESHGYLHDGAFATPMGPRDVTWLNRVANDGRAGFDIFPWAEAGTSAGYFLGRALAQMWTEVRWRPSGSAAETALFEEIVRDLESAYRIDPSREYPWTEWAEILAFLGRESLIATRAQLKASTAKTREPIGYRRNDVIAHLSGGWSIRLPGAFAEIWDDEGTFNAMDDTRTVWFTSLGFNSEDDEEPTVEETMEGLPPLPGDVVEEKEGPMLRRYTLSEEQDGDDKFTQIAAQIAVPGEVGILTVCFDAPDLEWGKETVRSLLRTE